MLEYFEAQSCFQTGFKNWVWFKCFVREYLHPHVCKMWEHGDVSMWLDGTISRYVGWLVDKATKGTWEGARGVVQSEDI
jgi:hypothetical protein